MPSKFCLFLWLELASRAAMLCMLCVIIHKIYVIHRMQAIVRHAIFFKCHILKNIFTCCVSVCYQEALPNFYSLLEQKETITLSAVDCISLKYMKLKSH